MKYSTKSSVIIYCDSDFVYKTFADIAHYSRNVLYSKKNKILKKNIHGFYKEMQARLPDGSIYKSRSVVRFFPHKKTFRVRQTEGAIKGLNWRLNIEDLNKNVCKVNSEHRFDLYSVGKRPEIKEYIKFIENELLISMKGLLDKK